MATPTPRQYVRFTRYSRNDVNCRGPASAQEIYALNFCVQLTDANGNPFGNSPFSYMYILTTPTQGGQSRAVAIQRFSSPNCQGSTMPLLYMPSFWNPMQTDITGKAFTNNVCMSNSVTGAPPYIASILSTPNGVAPQPMPLGLQRTFYTTPQSCSSSPNSPSEIYITSPDYCEQVLNADGTPGNTWSTRSCDLTQAVWTRTFYSDPGCINFISQDTPDLLQCDYQSSWRQVRTTTCNLPQPPPSFKPTYYPTYAKTPKPLPDNKSILTALLGGMGGAVLLVFVCFFTIKIFGRKDDDIKHDHNQHGHGEKETEMTGHGHGHH